MTDGDRGHLQERCGSSADRHYRDSPLEACIGIAARPAALKGAVYAGECSGWLSQRNSGSNGGDKQIVFDQ